MENETRNREKADQASQPPFPGLAVSTGRVKGQWTGSVDVGGQEHSGASASL